MKPVRNIIFDLGGVIINIDPERTIRYFSEHSGLPAASIKRQMETMKVFHRYESGQITDEQFFRLLRQITSGVLSQDQLIEGWNTLLLDIPPHKIKVIQELGKSYNVYLLSNTNHVHFVEVEKILQRAASIHSFSEIMKEVFLSYRLNMRKPDREIYRHVLTRQGLKPGETLFIDDNAENIKGAYDVGMNILHYKESFMNLLGYEF